MKPSFPSHLAKPLSHLIPARTARRSAHPRGRTTARLAVERMEQRTLLSTTPITWASDVSGDWDNPAMWTGGVVPGPGDDAVIAFSDITVTHTSSASDSVNSLTSQGAIAITGGSLSLASASNVNNALTLSSGATLTGGGNITVSGLFNWQSGTLAGAPTGGVLPTLEARGPVQIGDGALDSRHLILDQGATWGGGSVNFNGGSVVDSYGTFQAVSPSTAARAFGGAGTFNNHGSLTIADQGGGTYLGLVFNSSGPVDVHSGLAGFWGGYGVPVSTLSSSVTGEPGTTLGFNGLVAYGQLQPQRRRRDLLRPGGAGRRRRGAGPLLGQ
jgi:hypothetical protein